MRAFFKIMNSNRYFYKTDSFDLYNTFYNGQCFRWEKIAEGAFEGIAGNKPLRLYQVRNGVELECIESDFAFWSTYFDLATDYSAIEDQYKKDSALLDCVNVGSGMHILRQDLWEVIISFIISQNNNIARIKKIILNLSCKYGKEISAYGNTYYSFPTPHELACATESELKDIGLGYRADYIVKCTEHINKHPEFIPLLCKMDYASAREALLSVKGIGPKVANCILLFGLRKFEAFPVDTWINKAMKYLYPECRNSKNDIETYAKNRFGEYAGIAQQYIFYAARQGAIKLED